MINTKKPATLIIINLLMVAFSAAQAFASPSQYQQCYTNTVCEIGEFLFDDNYSPITNASCTINTKKPGGEDLLKNLPMTAQSDGWYSYDVTPPPDTYGLYRSQICCNASGDYLCIDKTFEVTVGSQDYADAVWSDSGRTSFLNEIWGHSSDSLGSFSSKITSIFNNSNTLTAEGGGGDDTATSVPDLSDQVLKNKALLEQVINQPVIQNFIEEDDAIPLSQKVDQAKSAINEIYSTTQTAKAKLGSLMLKWPTLTTTKINLEIADILSLLGIRTDTENQNTLMASLNTLIADWDNPIINDVLSATNNTITSINVVSNILEDSGSTDPQFQDSIIDALEIMSALEDSIGDASDSLADTTLFGFLRKIQSSTDSFGTSEADIDELIKNYDKYSAGEIKDKVDTLTQTVLANNQLDNARLILQDPTNPSSSHPKNTLYALKAIIDANKKDLTSASGNPVSSLWLQDYDGFMVFKGFILNPSTTNQTAQIKYSLPNELSESDIIKKSDKLTVAYDTSEESLIMSADYSLSPGELITFYVQVKDIWLLSDADLDATLSQAEQLLSSLRRTNLYAQASSLKSDIEVSLDKIRVKLHNYDSPETRIQAVRESTLDLLAIQDKINTLKDLVAQTSSAKSIVGAVGGIQTVAVWGLLLIFIAGFVFLVIFMRRMQPATAAVGMKRTMIARPSIMGNSLGLGGPLRGRVTRERTPRRPVRDTDFKPSTNAKAPYGRLALTGVLTIALAVVVVSLITRTGKPQTTSVNTPKPAPGAAGGMIMTGSETKQPTVDTQEIAQTTPEDFTVLGTTSSEMILEVGGKSVEIKDTPSSVGKTIMTLTSSQKVFVFEISSDPDTDDSFSRIGFSADDDNKDWWVPTSTLSSL